MGYDTGNYTGFPSGYTIGYSKGWSTTGFTLRDATYQEAIAFITLDQTDKNIYIDPTYVCHDFSYDVKRNAFKAGYRCFNVDIDFQDNIGHSITAFNTTDRGFLFIESQSDSIVKVEIGQRYYVLNGFLQPPFNDTIIQINIYP